MNISIFTATGHYNLGDELILLQEYEVLREIYKNANFYIFTYDKKSSLLEENKTHISRNGEGQGVRYIKYFPNNIKKKPFKNIKYLWKNIKTIYKSDLVVIGWGWLIYESEVQSSSSPIMQWKFRVFLAKFFRKKIVYLSVWINTSNPKKIKYLFTGKKTKVSVRDKKSQQILDKIWIKSIILTDPVFNLKPENKTKIPLSSERRGAGGEVWISLRKWYLKNEQDFIKQIILYLSKAWYKIVFLSHSIHQKDPLANDYLFLKDIAKKYNIEITGSISDTLKAYKKLDYVIGMRFHSLVLSIVYNIPFLALSYWQKTEELLLDFDYKFKLNSRELEFEDFIKKFSDLTQANNSLFDFWAKIDKIRQDYKVNITKLLKNGLE